MSVNRNFTKRVFRTKDAAEYLGKSPRTLEKWRAEGKGPDYRKEGDGDRAPVVYLKEVLDSWLDGLKRPD